MRIKKLNMLIEKSTDSWHRDREPMYKKIKTVASKMSGPRPPTPSARSSGSPTADSSSSTDSSESELDEESADYSESDTNVEPDEPSPLPMTRPVDPSKAVEYDVIKAVWAKRSSRLSGTVIRTALSEWWEIFKGIRDKWKSRTTSLQQAIEKKDTSNKNAFERRVVEQRRLLETSIRLTLKHGHPDLVTKYVFLKYFSPK